MSWQRLTSIRKFTGFWFWNLWNVRQNPHGLLQVRNTLRLITQNNTICWGLDYLTILFQVELVMSLNKITIWGWLVGTHRFSRDCNAHFKVLPTTVRRDYEKC
jgi:hypothetical protein